MGGSGEGEEADRKGAGKEGVGGGRRDGMEGEGEDRQVDRRKPGLGGGREGM